MQPRYLKKKIDGQTIAYRSIGIGHPVFCFPGWTLSSQSFLPLVKHLDTDNFRFILLDIPGWAGKSPKLKGKTTIHALAKIGISFTNAFNFPSFSLLGYSYGGALVQEIIKTKIMPVSSVILLSTLCEGGDSLKSQFDKPIQMYAHAKKTGVSDVVIREQISRIFNTSVIARLPMSHYSQNSAMDKTLREYFSGDIRAMIESGFSLLKHSYLSKRLTDLTTMVLYADEDMSFIVTSSKRIARFIGVKPIVVKGDHNHILFDPTASAKYINSFLQKNISSEMSSD